MRPIGSTSAGLERRKTTDDFLLHLLEIEIADRDERHTIRTIPRIVVVQKVGLLRVLEHLLGADGNPINQTCIGEEEIQFGQGRPLFDGIGTALLAQNDSALAIDFFGQERQIIGVVEEYLQSLVEVLGFGIRQIDHVDGAVKGGEGIGVAPEIHPHALKELDEGAGLVVFAAVEGHVLKKVGQAALFFSFLQRSRFDQQAEGDAFAGFGI